MINQTPGIFYLQILSTFCTKLSVVPPRRFAAGFMTSHVSAAEICYVETASITPSPVINTT
jgi:hypothetical protein